METTSKLTGTIDEQVRAILDYRSEEMWLDGIVYEGDYLDLDDTLSDVLEFRDAMAIPEGMNEWELEWQVRRAAANWADSVGLEPFSRSEVIEDAKDHAYGALSELAELDLDTLADVIPGRDMEFAAEMLRQAHDLLREAAYRLSVVS